MKTIFTILVLLITSSSSLAQDNLPDNFPKNSELILKSSYKFTYYMFDVYQVELYLASSVAAREALNNVPKKLQFKYFRDIPAKTLVEKATESLENIPGFNFDTFEQELSKLNNAYLDVKEDDQYIIQYTPEIGTELILNGKKLVTVAGKEFARFYFAIWLSEHSFSKDLYKTLTKS